MSYYINFSSPLEDKFLRGWLFFPFQPAHSETPAVENLYRRLRDADGRGQHLHQERRGER